MSKHFSLFLTVLLAFFIATLPVAAQPLQSIDRIAAVVNEDVILQSELDLAMKNILSQYADNPLQLPPRDVLERQLLDRLILVKLQVAQAQQTGIRVNDQELNQAIASIAQQNGVSVEGLAQRLEQDGLSMDDFRRSVKDEIMIQRLRQSFAQSRISISESEVNAALSQVNIGSMQYHLAHILVALPEGATPEQITTGQQKIDGVRALIENGELDFQAAAARYSDSPNALEGGDLGWRSLDEIPSIFAQVVPGMKAGDMFGPTRGMSGFQLLKLLDVRNSDASNGQQVTEYHARHILVRVNERQDDAAAKAKIDTLRARISGGADFGELARETSEDNSSRHQGGDLGWFPIDAYGLGFGQEVAKLQNNDVSQPFRTDAGWHIVQQLGSRQIDVTDENRRAQIRETIGRRKLEEEYNRYIMELRGEAYVSYRVGDQAENPSDYYNTAPPDEPARESRNTIRDGLNGL